ncbi:MAG: metallophosphoesterase [Planctomycetes bacterium]|nr:metallophosphoesterase [Planctomycetota bacterium]
MRFALISDCHCWSINLLPWKLAGKRFVGMSNLLLFRRNTFCQKVIKRNINRIVDINSDYVLLAGDVSQTSLVSEFRKARQVFMPVMDKLLAIPGNHDYYTTGTLIYKRFERIFLGFEKFPKNDVNIDEQFAYKSYPWVKNVNDIKIIGLNCAYPSFQAFGNVKEKHLEKLEAEIVLARQNNQKLIILNHFQYAYPKNMKQSFNHSLRNADKLIALLKNAPKTVYIHGHIHKPWIFVPSVTPNVLCINAASSGMKTSKLPYGLGFYEIEIEKDNLLVNRHVPVSETEWKIDKVDEFNNFWSN